MIFITFRASELSFIPYLSNKRTNIFRVYCSLKIDWFNLIHRWCGQKCSINNRRCNGADPRLTTRDPSRRRVKALSSLAWIACSKLNIKDSNQLQSNGSALQDSASSKGSEVMQGIYLLINMNTIKLREVDSLGNSSTCKYFQAVYEGEI